MNLETTCPTDPTEPEDVEHAVRSFSVAVLGYGSFACCVTLVIGLIWLAAEGGSGSAITSIEARPTGPDDILATLATHPALGLTGLGILGFISLPILEMAALAFVFARHRDRLYLLVSGFVLAVLLVNAAG